LKKYILGLLLIGLGVAMQQAHEAGAVTGTLYTTKDIALTIIVTPSPTPVGYVPGAFGNGARVASNAIPRSIMPPSTASMLAYQRFSMQDAVAQVTSSPQGHVQVNFTVRADPTSQYLHVDPITNPLYAGYGANTWLCAYEVYAYYPGYAYYVDDVVEGTVSNGSGPFPTYNAPTNSLLTWEAETSGGTLITTSYVAFSNGGGAGQQTFTGTAGEKQTNCINLQLNVPSTISAGTYQTTISYMLYVEL
jgi:hypothetical protein